MIIITVWHVAGVIFPLDEQLGLDRSVYSLQLSKLMVWLSGLLPYEQCQAVFERIGERQIPSSSIWRRTQHHGSRLQAYVEEQQEQVSVERVVLPDASHDHDQRKAISIDGGTVTIRGEGGREIKVGAVFDLETRLERNPQTQELEKMAHGVNLHYTAVLGSKQEFTPAMWALMIGHEVPTAKDRVAVADGAVWIWNVVEDLLPDGRQVVDWFHATQNLSELAGELYPNEADSHKRKRWFNTYKHHLYMGEIHKIIQALTNQNREDLTTYFVRHQRRMQYLQFREDGLPIGSGAIESGVKQFKQRLCGAGMRWNGDNANRMLVIRAAVLGNDFDDLWESAA